MKVMIKDLKPNPFRDMDNYPIDQKKIDSLTESISQTGFWDNILVRKQNGDMQIAYGHHRLIVLRKLFKPTDFVDIPVKEVTDSDMLRIMANENYDAWGSNVAVIDETVKAARDFLLKHPEIVKDIELSLNQFRDSYHRGGGHIKYDISARVISEFLGEKMWYVVKVNNSLRRLELVKNEILDKEAVESLPHESAARTFTQVVKNLEKEGNIISKAVQKKAAKNIVVEKKFDGVSMKKELKKAKTKTGKKKGFKEEENRIDFSQYLKDFCNLLQQSKDSAKRIMKSKDKVGDEYYEESFEKSEIKFRLGSLLVIISKLLEGEENVKKLYEETLISQTSDD